jgi:hypothetical protein
MAYSQISLSAERQKERNDMRYYTETCDKRASKYLILDHTGSILKATNNNEDITGVTEVTKNQNILACYDNNVEIGNGYFIKGERVDGALTEATKAFI